MKDSVSMSNAGRVPIYKPAQCLGEACPEYGGSSCTSRWELLEATGESGGEDLAPKVADCDYALYGQVCMAGAEQVVVGRAAESPNSQAGSAELIGRAGRTDGQKIVLTTPPEAITFAD